VWSTPIDQYCERLDPSFWAEPVNALTNAAFIAAAIMALMDWRRGGSSDRAVLALIMVVFAIGLGSFAFHTLATRGAKLLDVIPIGMFIYGYLLLALRRMLGMRWVYSVVLLVAFMVLSNALAIGVPREVLNGSTGYFPALGALLIIGWLLRDSAQGRAMLIGAAIFTVSLALRIVDLDICNAFPLGTHFLWHVLNAGLLYLLLRSALARTRTSEVIQ
jgi:hypothetical protein